MNRPHPIGGNEMGRLYFSLVELQVPRNTRSTACSAWYSAYPCILVKKSAFKCDRYFIIHGGYNYMVQHMKVFDQFCKMNVVIDLTFRQCFGAQGTCRCIGIVFLSEREYLGSDCMTQGVVVWLSRRVWFFGNTCSPRNFSYGAIRIYDIQCETFLVNASCLIWKSPQKWTK